MIRIGDPVGEVIVVCHQEQSACVLIEPPDRRNPLADVRQQVVYGRPTLRIFVSRYVAFWFIQQKIDLLPLCQRFAVKLYAVRLGVHPVIGCLNDLPVNLHAPRADPASRVRPGSDPRARKDAIERLLHFSSR